MLLLEDKTQTTTTHYDVLGIPKNASQKTIRAAYKRMSKIHHPDAGGNAEVFRQVQEAYEVLSDDERRFLYDTLNYTPQELEGALNLVVAHIIGLFKDSPTLTEKSVRSKAKALLRDNLKEVVKTKADVNSGTFLLNRVIAEIDNPTGFINNLVIKNLRNKVQINEQAIRQLNQQQRVIDVALVLVDKMDFKRKDTPFSYEQWASGVTSTSSTITASTIKFNSSV